MPMLHLPDGERHTASNAAAQVNRRISVATWSFLDLPVWSFLAHIANLSGQRRLNIHVDIFQAEQTTGRCPLLSRR